MAEPTPQPTGSTTASTLTQGPDGMELAIRLFRLIANGARMIMGDLIKLKWGIVFLAVGKF